MTAGAGLLDPEARQPKDDFGLRCAAEKAIGARVRRGRVTAHREAKRRGGESLALLPDRMARTPPPGAMNKRTVRRIHQPDDRMVDCCCEAHTLDEIGRSSVKPINQRDIRCC